MARALQQEASQERSRALVEPPQALVRGPARGQSQRLERPGQALVRGPLGARAPPVRGRWQGPVLRPAHGLLVLRAWESAPTLA